MMLTGFGNRAIDISAKKLERCIRYVLDRAHILGKLRSQEARYRNLLEKSRDGVLLPIWPC